MNSERIKELNNKKENLDGDYILYVMHSSLRVELNLALNYAITLANSYSVKLYIVFAYSFMGNEINERQFIFLTDGLYDFLQKAIANGYKFIILDEKEENKIVHLIDNAVESVCDKGYLNIDKENEKKYSLLAQTKCIEIEDNLIIPIDFVTDKQEWAAHTLRPKLHKVLEYFLQDANEKRPILNEKYEWSEKEIEETKNKIDNILYKKNIKSENIISSLKGGEDNAKKKFYDFVANLLPFYSDNRNEPSLSCTSRLSPYLHFGNISPLLIYDVIVGNGGDENFLEQLLVRRELSNNYVYYNDDYEEYKGLPEWSRKTLNKHISDKREFCYSIDELQNCDTHDIFWNAAMRQMIETGFLENTMRMYWGKKILEWTKDPEEAFNISLYLNNLYLLDGWDANSYVGVGWCFGLHDRPWKERDIFGTVRYMNAAGLQRKYNMDEYVYLWGE